MIPYISSTIMDQFNANNQHYWSDDFSPEFYITLSKMGLISTSFTTDDYGDVLLPELQEAYAVLDFKNLHISKQVKKLLISNYRLEITEDFNLFLPLLKEHHGSECWFTDRYIEMVYKLFELNRSDNNFSIKTVLLYCGDRIAAGEIGYFIGSTYTSLTGFFNREFSNWGTFQLILLAKKLEAMGMDFWNLGHPYMEYKLKIGAKVLKRDDFLERWNISTIKRLQPQ